MRTGSLSSHVRGASRILVLALGAVLAGCGTAASGPPAAGSVGPSAGPGATASSSPRAASASPSLAATTPGPSVTVTGRIALPNHGYAITLAAGWTRIDLGGDLVAEVLAAGGSADYASQFPALKDQLVSSGLSMFALRRPDARVSGGTTLTVQDNPIATVSLDDYEKVVKSQLQTTLGPGTTLAATRVSAPAGTFLRMSYRITQSSPAITNIHFFLVTSGKQIVITCSSPETGPSLGDECDAIATSLEILP